MLGDRLKWGAAVFVSVTVMIVFGYCMYPFIFRKNVPGIILILIVSILIVIVAVTLLGLQSRLGGI